MCNLKNIVFVKAYNKNKSCLFRIKIEWEKDYFKIYVLESNNSWYALVTTNHLQNLSQIHDVEFEVYFKNLRHYLCNEDPSFSINIENKTFFLYRFTENGLQKIKYFTVPLENCEYQDTVEHLLDELIQTRSELINKKNVLEKEVENVQKQKQEFQQKCDDFIKLKNKADLQMYSSFLLLLNEKKKRICYLTEMLEKYKNGINAETINLDVQTKEDDDEILEPQPSTSKEKKTYSDSDSTAENLNTDDEKSNADYDDLQFLDDDIPNLPIIPFKRKKSENIEPLNQCETNNPFDEQTQKLEERDVQLQEFPQVKENVSKEILLNTQELLDQM